MPVHAGIPNEKHGCRQWREKQAKRGGIPWKNHFYLRGSMFVDNQNIGIILWVTGLFRYNLRQFITLGYKFTEMSNTQSDSIETLSDIFKTFAM